MLCECLCGAAQSKNLAARCENDVKPELNFHHLNDLTSFGPKISLRKQWWKESVLTNYPNMPSTDSNMLKG